MAKRQYADLLLIIILTILAVAFIKTPCLRKIFIWNALGLLFILFIPGYSFLAAISPKTSMGGLERAGLSFGLSVTFSAIIGLTIKYTHWIKYLMCNHWVDHLTHTLWGVKLTHFLTVPPNFTIYMVLSIFTLFTLFIALIRRWRTYEDERFSVYFSLKPLRDHFKGESRTNKIISVIIIIAIILAVSATVYIIVKPPHGEKFTEFYILGENGKAADYPTNMTVGETGNVTIGIVNHDYKTVDYNLVVESNNTITMQKNVTLGSGAKVEIPYNFTVESAGQNEIKFTLYKLPDEKTIYRDLHIWVNVS